MLNYPFIILRCKNMIHVIKSHINGIMAIYNDKSVKYNNIRSKNNLNMSIYKAKV